MAKQRELLPEQPVQEATPEATDSATGLNGRMRRAVCPVNPEHGRTRVYKTAGRVRHCVCDDCGKTWKQTGAKYSRASEWAEELAETLEKEARNCSTVGTRQVVVLDVNSVRKIATQLRNLASEADRAELDVTPAA
jgi:hypothetical protein